MFTESSFCKAGRSAYVFSAYQFWGPDLGVSMVSTAQGYQRSCRKSLFFFFSLVGASFFAFFFPSFLFRSRVRGALTNLGSGASRGPLEREGLLMPALMLQALLGAVAAQRLYYPIAPALQRPDSLMVVAYVCSNFFPISDFATKIVEIVRRWFSKS